MTASVRLASILVVSLGVVSFLGTAAEAQAPSAKTLAARAELARGTARDFGPPPPIPQGELADDVRKAIDTAFGDNLATGEFGAAQSEALGVIAESGDVRVTWIIADLMRFVRTPQLLAILAASASKLMGVKLDVFDAWGPTTDHLIAWKVPAPPGYLPVKRRIFTRVVPEWDRIFVPGDVDWRHVSWGGVRIDDRPYGQTDVPCNCIPAADDPPVTSAADATWLSDDAVVFGVTINGESRAYPRRIMEVREMVNDTLGGRDLGIPYCTLCGAAQAWFTDRLPEGVERPILRTSGLLVRSNKVMYDITSWSVMDTFRGTALTGPLAERGVKLEQAGVVTTTWGEWKAAHPGTTVLAEHLALGRDFDFRNNRDADGPIFPIGDVDPRLAVQEDVLGIVTASGTPVAFHVNTAREALRRGEVIQVENVHLMLDGGGVRAVDAAGQDLGAHQAFWFAWSQFHPQTRLWPLD